MADFAADAVDLPGGPEKRADVAGRMADVETGFSLPGPGSASHGNELYYQFLA